MSRPAKDGILKHQVHSPTAASAGNPLFGPSGPMVYRVQLATGLGFQFEDVEAATGDEAAEKALAKYPGCKVAHVAPAPQRAEQPEQQAA